ncbi:MAG: phosphotransferase family protein [Alphaproteobacteria bacterium]
MTADASKTEAKAAVDAEGFLIAEASQPQDWEKLAVHLKKAGLAFEALPAPRQFAGGFGNLNYLLSVDGKPMVLRRPPPGPLPPGANDMGREYRVLSRLWREFPLAPRALHFCDDEAVLGKPFFLMEHRTGRVVRAELPGDIVGHEPALAKLLVDVLGALHAVDPAAVGLEDLGRPEGFLERTVAGWTKRLSIASADIFDDKLPPKPAREIAAWLGNQSVPDSGITLLHNDYKLDNVMLAEGVPPKAVAVFDWDQCTRGAPLFDFATFLSYWVEANDPPAMMKLNQMPTRLPGFPGRREVVEMYASASGRDVSDFLFYRVLGMMKLGVIFLQLYARYCRGETRDPRYAELGAMGDGIFDFTIEIIEGRAF